VTTTTPTNEFFRLMVAASVGQRQRWAGIAKKLAWRQFWQPVPLPLGCLIAERIWWIILIDQLAPQCQQLKELNSDNHLSHWLLC
jgi:hypothetical protein